MKTQRCQFLLLYLITASFPGRLCRLLLASHAGGCSRSWSGSSHVLVSGEQQSVSQRLLSKHLGLWALVSGAVIAALMVARNPHCDGSDAQLA